MRYGCTCSAGLAVAGNWPRAAGRGKSAVADCLRRAKVAGLSGWPVVPELDDAELSQ